MADLTQLLIAVEQGDAHAATELLPLVYNEMRLLAANKLAHESPGQTLQPTALVHEAYLRLIGGKQPTSWQNQAHFFAAAAEAMRRILIDIARRKQADKRGGGRRRVLLEEAHLISDQPDELLAVDEALTRFTIEEPDKAALVKLRFFGGLSTPEAAAMLGISLATAERWWAYSRSWLYSELQSEVNY